MGNTFQPYHCLHLSLDHDLNLPAVTNSKHGYYIVVWWKEIPLGQFFLRPEEVFDYLTFEKKIIHAVSLALTFYTKNDQLSYSKLKDVQSICQYTFQEHQNIPNVCNASVVICTKDRADLLQNCLQSLMLQRCKPAEIIVVDNASADDRTKKTAEQFPDVKYVRENRLGLDIARNTGARVATQPIVMYTDDDTIIHPLWVHHTCKTFDDPTVAAMTGLVLASELNTEAQWIFERFWPFNRGFIDKRYDETFFKSTLTKGPPVWNIGAGANMAFRKKIFEEVGYFDERLDVGAAGCSGDSEIWYRILASGKAIHYNPRAVVSHFHRSDMDKFQEQIFFYMRGFTAALLIQYDQFRHRGNLRHLVFELPKYYCWLLMRGFPFYKGRHKTIFSEMKGILSGIFFYLKNRNTPSNIF